MRYTEAVKVLQEATAAIDRLAETTADLRDRANRAEAKLQLIDETIRSYLGLSNRCVDDIKAILSMQPKRILQFKGGAHE